LWRARGAASGPRNKKATCKVTFLFLVCTPC
jgi:hypothetical protein